MKQRKDRNVQRLERDLNKLETALSEHYYNIGKQLLEMVEQEDHEINNLVDEIIDIKKQLYELNQTVQCPSCFLMNSNESRYCSHCGNEL
jgi:uncharacterized protein YoxC